MCGKQKKSAPKDALSKMLVYDSSGLFDDAFAAPDRQIMIQRDLTIYFIVQNLSPADVLVPGIVDVFVYQL